MGRTDEEIEAYMRIQETIRKQGIARVYASIRIEERKDINTCVREEGYARIKEEERKHKKLGSVD